MNEINHFAEELLKVAFKMSVPSIPVTQAGKTTEGAVAKPLTTSPKPHIPKSVVKGISLKGAKNVPSASGKVMGVKVNPSLKNTPPPESLYGGSLVS